MNMTPTSADPRRHRDPGAARTTLVFSADEGDAPSPITASVEGFASVSWQPCRATIAVDDALESAAVSAVTAFQARHDALQALLQPLSSLEAQAHEDVPLCYRIEGKDHAQWPRLLAVMQGLARTRLRISTLTDELRSDPAGLSPPAAELLRKLVKAAGLQGRLERLSERYETLEDLYEGAVDRVNDHRYWRDGHRLEIIIIVVLVAETLLLLWEWLSY